MNTESIFLIIAVLIVLISVSKHGLFGTVAVFALIFSIAHFGFDVTGPTSALLSIIFMGMGLFHEASDNSSNSGPIVITEAMRKADRDLCERLKYSKPVNRNDYDYGKRNRRNGYLKRQTFEEFARSKGYTGKL